ncbi:MAG: ATP-binding protein [Candidatus Altiarchaeota archaeon]|nr:ATP-binding protein [Candidatus Altiarchaeota archaeon]
MAQTFATSQYREKLIANMTFAQSAIMLLLTLPFVFGAMHGYPTPYLVAYAILLVAVYSSLTYFGADETVGRMISYAISAKHLLWDAKNMKKFIGIEDIYSDCVHTTDGRVLSVISVQPNDLGGLSEDDAHRAISGYGRFLHELSTNIQIIMSTTEVDLEKYMDSIEENMKNTPSSEKKNYFQHFREFTSTVAKSKTITDRRYHVVVSHNRMDGGLESEAELEVKTNNLMSSLTEVGIGCRRLKTDELVDFYACVYKPRKRIFEFAPFPEGIQDDQVKINYSLGRDYVARSLDRKAYVLEQIMPVCVDFERDHAVIEKVHKVLYVVRFPAVVSPGWLTKIINQAIDLDLVVHIHPLSQKTSLDYLQHELTKLETDVTTREMGGYIVCEKDRATLHKVRELLNRVSRDEERCFDVAMYVNVKAHTEKELKESVMRVKDIFEGMNLQVNEAKWEMYDALISCYPIAKDRLGSRRDRIFPSSAVRDTYPFILSCLEEKDSKSIIVGYNQLNGVPVIIDFFKQQNPHAMVLGTSGSGKSFLVKKLVLALALQDIDIFIIDPQGEYRNPVELLGGEVIRLAPDSDSCINIFDIQNDTYDGRKKSLKAFFNIIGVECGGDYGSPLGVIDKMIDNAYKKRGIYQDEPKTYNRMAPNFEDVYESLNQFASESNAAGDRWKKATAESLLTYLVPFVSGELNYLNAKTNIKHHGKNIICFDVSSCAAKNSTEKALILFMTFDYIKNIILNRPSNTRKIVIVDEAWCVFENNQDYLSQIARTGRKNNISLILIDQSVEDFLTKDETGVERGHAILNNTATKFLLRQETAGLRLVAEKFGLTKSQENYLKNAGVGDALMITPNLRLPIHVLASKTEKKNLTTNPEEVSTPTT